MGDFPQFDFKELDGRQTPFVKPQHYKKGSTTETDLTGHDNPLPTADYGMTESGVWIPKRVDDEGNTLTQVTGSKLEKIKEYNYETEKSNNAYFGETVRTGPSLGDDLDISNYKNISIAVKNNTDKEFTCRGIYVRTENASRDLERYYLIDIDVPSNSTAFINKSEQKEMEAMEFFINPFLPYMRFRILNNDGLGEGNIEVILLGDIR